MRAVKYIGLCSAILVVACNSNQTSPPVIKKHADSVEPYENLYDSPFNGSGPYHEIDTIDFLTPDERKPIEDSLFSLSYSGYDKSYGYNFEENFYPASISSHSRNVITWLGHASFLIQDNQGNSYLTDPVFGEFDGIVGTIGTVIFDELKRLGPAPVDPKELTFVDSVLISHNHYDHFSNETLSKLGDDADIFLPLGMQNELASHFNKVYALDWFTEVEYKQSNIHFVPAHHNSQRGVFDKNESLWGGWVINTGEHTIYFSGDTGYSQIFKDIQKKYGDFDVCMMPIGAYGKHYRSLNLAPEDALKAAQDLQCKVFVPWGYGTWQLGFEHVNEPLRRLAYAAKIYKPDFKVRVLRIGESFKFTELL
ncbi:hypothetical protein A7985_21080 [Pseudoalteromonas luteoviolacea]|uniref:Metallo-beta-lactamase domain-containing protein n=1 Tax=Pseudoalteromonas luteoviolacea TaxID=43657 RepID=A0A1C0TL67_9GAMM|nr:MBL fold metallo-hydrolase [Pseudoalteromonas luteoviolacea]MBQ4812669.1 MBL fold metallo-hydrolase [Pseudoalteromonas luteoviolacea]OCQ19229.1 hypothetical protein A7985_21080 [Pseudoalteromonas luteoviolacea]